LFFLFEVLFWLIWLSILVIRIVGLIGGILVIGAFGEVLIIWLLLLLLRFVNTFEDFFFIAWTKIIFKLGVFFFEPEISDLKLFYIKFYIVFKLFGIVGNKNFFPFKFHDWNENNFFFKISIKLIFLVKITFFVLFHFFIFSILISHILNPFLFF
jgi:hypothetical protein